MNDYPYTNDKRPPTANDSNHNMSPTALLEALDIVEKEIKYVAKKVKLTLMSNWGQRHLIGLTGEDDHYVTYLRVPRRKWRDELDTYRQDRSVLVQDREENSLGGRL